MTYIDPQGNRTAAAPTGSSQVPVVNLGEDSQKQQNPQIAVPLAANDQNVPQTPAEKFRRYIETEALDIIRQLIEKGCDAEKIQKMAKKVLDLIRPGMSIEELYRNAVKLDDEFSELGPVVIKVMREYEERYEKKSIGEVSSLIKSGKYTEAQDLVKKILLFKAAG